MKNKSKSVFLAAILIVSLLLGSTCAFADSTDSSISASKSAVVRVYSEFDYGGGYFGIGTGSAFGVGAAGSTPEYFVTNAHVCLDENGDPATDIYILLDNKAVSVEYNEAGEAVSIDIDKDMVVECEIVNDDIELFPDVAVLKAKKPVEGRSCLPLAESSENISDGETVYSLGYPGDADILTFSRNKISIVADVSEVTLTSGVISKKTSSELYDNTDVILHTANISEGNSGGPLVDSRGAVVGINTYAISNSGTQYVSIFIDYARDVLDEAGVVYETYSESSSTRTIILYGIIAAVIVIATALVIFFKKKEKQWVENEQRKEEIQANANALRIQGVSGYFNGRRFSIENQLTIGRDPGNNIVFPTQVPGVSANHCVITRINDQLYIKDLGSSYGTVINGNQRLPENQLISIRVGDKISLGSMDQTFIITRKGGVI